MCVPERNQSVRPGKSHVTLCFAGITLRDAIGFGNLQPTVSFTNGPFAVSVFVPKDEEKCCYLICKHVNSKNINVYSELIDCLMGSPQLMIDTCMSYQS